MVGFVLLQTHYDFVTSYYLSSHLAGKYKQKSSGLLDGRHVAVVVDGLGHDASGHVRSTSIRWWFPDPNGLGTTIGLHFRPRIQNRDTTLSPF